MAAILYKTSTIPKAHRTQAAELASKPPSCAI